MSFDLTQVPLQIPEAIAFRNDALGNLSANWTIFQGTNADIQVKTDVVNIAWSPTTATSAVTAIYNARFPSTEWFRFSASQRYVSAPLGFGVGIGMWLSKTASVPFSFTPRRYTFILQGAAPTYVYLGYEDFVKTIPVTLNANKWYRTGIEVIGKTINFYFNPTGDANITNVSNETNMVKIFSAPLNKPVPPQLFAGISLSAKAVGVADYTGVGDIALSSLLIPAPPQSGIFNLTGPQPTAYAKYKTAREAVQVYNNLVLGV